MPSIQVKNVPEDVHRIYRERAAAVGQSLQEFLLHQLIANARQPSMAEVLDRLEEQSGGELSPDFVLETLRADRSLR